MRADAWPELLQEHLAAWAGVRLVWGSTDCLQFVSAWVHRARGDNPAARWIGHYAGPVSAQRIIRAHGRADLFDFVDYLLGDGLPDARAAQRGDVVAAQGSLGICLGARGAFLAEAGGLQLLPAAEFSRAWRV